ncbi:hypothetical protein [Nocardioides dilutus]
MNHDEATRYFDALGAVTQSRPPVSDLVIAGQTAERRKRRWTVMASVAAVALVLGGGTAVQQVVAGDDEQPKPPPEQAADVPVAPDGMRFAGMGRVVVAVPESWGKEHECAPDVIGPATACQRGEDSTATLSFFTLADLYNTEIDGPHDSTYNGVDVIEGPLACPPTASCVGPMPYAVQIPSQGVGFMLGGSYSPMRAAIVESIRLLPEGFTTVPYLPPGLTRREAERVVEAAGLEVHLNGPDVNTSIAGTEPAAGFVVRVSSTVTLLRAAGGSSSSVPQALTCPTEMRAAADAPFFDESAPGATTPEAAVEAWLEGAFGRSFGPEYVMDEDKKHAWILRADGTAEARVTVKLTAGGGYFYYGHEACG